MPWTGTEALVRGDLAWLTDSVNHIQMPPLGEAGRSHYVEPGRDTETCGCSHRLGWMEVDVHSRSLTQGDLCPLNLLGHIIACGQHLKTERPPP